MHLGIVYISFCCILSNKYTKISYAIHLTLQYVQQSDTDPAGLIQIRHSPLPELLFEIHYIHDEMRHL